MLHRALTLLSGVMTETSISQLADIRHMAAGQIYLAPLCVIKAIRIFEQVEPQLAAIVGFHSQLLCCHLHTRLIPGEKSHVKLAALCEGVQPTCKAFHNASRGLCAC